MAPAHPHHSLSSPLAGKSPGRLSRLNIVGDLQEVRTGSRTPARLRTSVELPSISGKAGRFSIDLSGKGSPLADPGDTATRHLSNPRPNTSAGSSGTNGSAECSSSGGSGSDSDSGGGYDVDKALALARKRASMRARATSSRLAKKTAVPALLARLGELDDDDELTPKQLREQVQIERSRETLREFLISRRLLEPTAGLRGPPPGALSNGVVSRTRIERASQSQCDLPTLSASPMRMRPGLTQLSRSGSMGAAGLQSAPDSPIAVAATRRRAAQLDPLSSPRSPSSPGIFPSPSRRSSSQVPHRRSVAVVPGGGGGDGYGEEGGKSNRLPRLAGVEALAEEEGSAYDLEDQVREERRRLAKVQSKVGDMLKSQQRYQGLLAKAPTNGVPKGDGQGGPNGEPGSNKPLTLTPEELTASIIPTPAKPPDGVELKVPQDDIRFSGVRLRFLMGLLEGLEQQPVLCRTTAELVQHVVVPYTADQKCRLLDVVPAELRGQPHHYICHAWSCGAVELLQTLRREMLPPAPPRPPPLSLPKPGAKPAANVRGVGGLRVQHAAKPQMAGGLAPGMHLPSLGGPKGGAAEAGGAAADSDNEAAKDSAYTAILGSPEAVWRHYEEMLNKYREEMEKALDQVVWIDMVCNNQHALTKKDYSKVAKTVVGCGATVVVLDPALTPLTRTWCLFEVMHCLRCKRHLKVFHVEASAATERRSMTSVGGALGPGLETPGDADKRWERTVEGISIQDSKAALEADRVGILQEVLNTVGMAYVNDTIKKAMRLSNSDRARQLALRREQLRLTMALLQPDPAIIGTEEYENNLAKCREHLQDVLNEFYPEDMMRCIIPRDYVSDSARCWDMLCIFAEILDRELFREDAKALRGMAWLIFKRHSKRYIEVLYEKELDNWLVDSLEHDRKWRRVQAKLKHDAQKKWS